jgi:hypothetical protein
MEVLVPILTATFLCAVGLALFLGHRREVAAIDRDLDRRMRPQPASEPLAGGAAMQHGPERARQAVRPARLGDNLLRGLDRWLAQGGMKIPATRFLALMAMMGLGGTVLTGL